MRIKSAAAFEAASTSSDDPGLMDEIVLFWRQFVVAAFNPYRPEKHYMRGPGPAWRAKHMAALGRDGAAS